MAITFCTKLVPSSNLGYAILNHALSLNYCIIILLISSWKNWQTFKLAYWSNPDCAFKFFFMLSRHKIQLHAAKRTPQIDSLPWQNFSSFKTVLIFLTSKLSLDLFSLVSRLRNGWLSNFEIWKKVQTGKLFFRGGFRTVLVKVVLFWSDGLGRGQHQDDAHFVSISKRST